MRKLLLLSAATLPLLVFSAPVDARIRGGVATAAPANTCPNGTANSAYDGCEEASLTGMYHDPNMNDQFKDGSGNVATLSIIPGLQSGKFFNVAGRDFPISVQAPYVWKNSTDYYFNTTGSNVNGTTFTAGTVTYGTVRDGLYLWSSPASAGIITNGPVLSNCTGGVDGSHPGGGGSGTVCTLSISQTNKSGPYKGSHARGCSFADNGAAISIWTCDFRYPNNAVTAVFDHFDFAPGGGRGGMRVRISDGAIDNGVPTLVVTNGRFKIDTATAGTTFVYSGTNARANLVFTDNDCNGGNYEVAAGAAPAAFPFPTQASCVNWSGKGLDGNHITVEFKRNRIYGWAGNPIQLATAFADITSQANVWDKVGMNNGETSAFPGATALHGATINFNSTTVGSKASVRRYNDVAIYPPGFRAGVTTAPFAMLAGIGTGLSVTYDQRFTTTIMNVSANPGQAIAQAWVDFLRVGQVDNVTVQDNYVATVGITGRGCYLLGADMSENYNSSVTASTGNGYSIYSISGISGTADVGPIPFPGQYLNDADGSATLEWTATLTNLGTTSRMDVLSVQFPFTGILPTLDPSTQVAALRMTDTQACPTLIVSGTGMGPYIVSNGCGSGETRAAQSFRHVQVIQPFGTNGTTATGGTTKTNYNGTYSLGGEKTRATSTNFVAQGAKIGNVTTIDTDISRNYDVLSGSTLTVDGIALKAGLCPGTTG